MKKTVEITRELLFGRRRLTSNLRAGFTLALAFAVWLRPPLGALAGCAVFFLLSGAALLRALAAPARYRIASALLAPAASGAVFFLFPRRDRLGVIGIGLWIIVLGLAHLPELRRGAGRTAETVTAFFETLLPFLLGCTFIWCVYGSFDLSAPFYALTLGILALQRFR